MLNYFDKALLSQIPEQLLKVPYLVEEKTGISLKIQDMDELFAGSAPGFSRALAVLDINCDEQAITLWVAPGIKLAAHMISHELIHLRRNILEGVPKIFPRTNIEEAYMTESYFLENELEHLFIIPEEISLFPEAEAWWAEHYRQQIEKVRTEQVSIAHHWRTIRIALPKQTELIQACAAIIRDYDSRPTERLANEFYHSIAGAMPNKHEMILELIDMFPREIVFTIGVGRFTCKPNGNGIGQEFIALGEHLPRPARFAHML
ncbi:hypothetical protein [Polaromonas hydrogenivorans]|uniref:IrrE N-terminal-like domain-containing protein n=1 Tax=Polaromonas hydrogenivorans TaxID=335476 RepID=A0AAU7M074_9BURK